MYARAKRRLKSSMVNNLLSAAEVWSTIGSVALAILILLVMITIHEFGHYVAGKIFHFKINEFSIGFGPAVFKHRNKKTDELFAVRLIPLGGYCAFEGEDGLDEEENESGKKKKGKEEAPFPELDGQMAEAVQPAESVKKQPHPDAFTQKKPWQRIIVLVSGALMNYLLALLLIVIGFFAYGQTTVAVYEAEPTDEITAEYCLQDRDIMLSAEGKNLYLTTDIARALNGKKTGDLVSFRVSRVVGQTDEGKNIREEREVKIMLRADVEVHNSADLDCVWKALGIRYVEDDTGSGYMLATSYYKFGFWETLGRSFAYSFKIADSIFRILGELLTGKLGISALGGPVTTITMTSQIVSRGFRSFLEIAGYIGVNLAVFNLLPIPALDGSKVIFTFIEWVRGKPVNRKVEAIIHAVGFVLLFGFAILVDFLQFI